MGINIFAVETDAAPRQSFETVGRFRAGHLVGKRPQSLEAWRLTSDDPEVTKAIAEAFGGELQGWDNERQPFEVFTDATSIPIILEKVFSGMTLWGRSGPVHKCDGEVMTFPEDQAGDACPMAGKSIEERKAAAQNGTGCTPDIALRFRVQGMYELGVFEFRSGSWGLAKEISSVEAKLASFGGTAFGDMALEPVEFVQKSTGLNRRFVKSSVTLTGAAS